MARVNVGKRIFQDPVTQVFKTISVFSEIEPEPEANQIREYRPNLAEILAAAAAEQAPEPVIELPQHWTPTAQPGEMTATDGGSTPLTTPEPPAKPKRIWKPRPNRKKVKP